MDLNKILPQDIIMSIKNFSNVLQIEEKKILKNILKGVNLENLDKNKMNINLIDFILKKAKEDISQDKENLGIYEDLFSNLTCEPEGIIIKNQVEFAESLKTLLNTPGNSKITPAIKITFYSLVGPSESDAELGKKLSELYNVINKKNNSQ